MAILRNIQIAKKYNITPATVGNWIEQAKANKIGLELTSVNGKYYIEDTEQNQLEIERLKKQGVKFRSKQTGVVKVDVNPKLYEIFTQEQLVSLFVNIAYYNFIPVKLSYTGEGAYHFDEGFQKAIENPQSGQALELNLIEKYFESVSERIITDSIEKSRKMNIIELGADNSTYALINGLKSLKEKDYLNKYVSVGISLDMAKIRENTILNKVNIPIQHYIYDIEENILRNLLFKERENNNFINLCTLLFSSLSNIRNISALLANLVESLSPNDYLMVSTIITDYSTNDHLIQSKSGQYLVKRHTWLLDLLGLTPYISSQYYNYDSSNRIRSSYFIMNRDVEINFKIDGKDYPILLKRDQKITFFISNRYTIAELLVLFRNAGFIVDQYNTDRGQKFALFLLRTQ